MKKPAIETLVLDQLLDAQANGTSVDEKVEYLRVLRQTAEVCCQIDRTILDRLTAYPLGLGRASVSGRAAAFLVLG